MDAYVFAGGVTPEAVQALRALVDAGDLRVLLPLAGEHSLYVAVSGESAAELQQRLDRVRTSAAPADLVVYPAVEAGVGAPPAYALRETPTWRPPRDVIGFALLACDAGRAEAVYERAAQVPGVIGLAVVAPAEPAVLVEVTDDLQSVVQQRLAELAELPGVVSSSASVGFASTASRNSS